VSFDVLEEAPFGSNFADDSADLRPWVTRIGFAPAQAGEGEWLAGISASDERYLSTPRAAFEGDKVVPDRSAIQGRVSHPRHEGGCSKCFPLDETDSSVSGFCDMDADLQASNAGAEGEAGKSFIGM
jgi:hypothetical protein